MGCSCCLRFPWANLQTPVIKAEAYPGSSSSVTPHAHHQGRHTVSEEMKKVETLEPYRQLSAPAGKKFTPPKAPKGGHQSSDERGSCHTTRGEFPEKRGSRNDCYDHVRSPSGSFTAAEKKEQPERTYSRLQPSLYSAFMHIFGREALRSSTLPREVINLYFLVTMGYCGTKKSRSFPAFLAATV